MPQGTTSTSQEFFSLIAKLIAMDEHVEVTREKLSLFTLEHHQLKSDVLNEMQKRNLNNLLLPDNILLQRRYAHDSSLENLHIIRCTPFTTTISKDHHVVISIPVSKN